MKIEVYTTDEEFSQNTARFVIEALQAKPNLVLGLPTGSTPLGMYQELIKAYQRGIVSFANVTTFNLDEYQGMSADNPHSYHYFMWKNFLQHIDVKKENVFIPRGDVPADEFCVWYEQQIRSRGGIDLQILGLGHNGHIGFNEPDSLPDSRTRVVHLLDSTLRANARFFEDGFAQPTTTITMGLGTIMEAKKIVLLVRGEDKAAIVRDTLRGAVTTQVPASLLQQHPEVTVVLDIPAATLLS